MSPKNTLCSCSFRGCGNSLDPNTGQYGVKLTARNYLLHQQEEKHHLMSKVLRAQQEAVRAQETTIEDALSRMSLNSDAKHEESLRQAEAKYRNEKVKAMLGYYSSVLEDIKKEKETILGVSTDSTGLPGLKMVYSVLQSINDSRAFVSRTKNVSLRKINRGPLRNEPATETMRQESLLAVQDLEDLISEVEPFWQRSLDEHNSMLASTQEMASTMYETAYHFLPIMAGSSTIVQLVAFMIVVAHIILGLSRRGSHWLFEMTDYIIQTTADEATFRNIPHFIQNLLGSFPRDPRTAASYLRIEPAATIYAACPKCDKLYRSTLVNNIPTYRERCSFRRYRHGSQCKTLLTCEKAFQSTTIKVPIKPFVSFSVKDWLASLTSRVGMEGAMDDAWTRTGPPTDGSIDDIFQASYIKNFKGKDGKPFSQSGNSDSGRYLFSLGFDFFNPLRNLAAGKKISIGIIALVCLNLPINIRYRPENIFLAGIIPGPKEPTLDAVNPYFRPTVNEFLELWQGVFFTRTALFEFGRLILCALIAIIADLPGARKAGGFVACTHEFFCSLCWCSRTSHSLNDFAHETWKLRTNEECRKHAQEYRAAERPGTAQRVVDRTGLRSSEFLRLPYYDPTINLVVDPMHNLFLGLIKEHFQNIIGCQGTKDSNEAEDDDDIMHLVEPDTGDGEPEIAANMVPTTTTEDAQPTTDGLSTSIRSVQPSPNIELSIRPTENNPLPESAGGKKTVRQLTSWLGKTGGLALSRQEAIEKFSGKTVTINALVYVGKAVGCFAATMSPRGKDTAASGTKYSKADLAEMLVDWQQKRLEALSSQDSTGPRIFRDPGKILTSNEMAELRRDIQALVKPSWLASIPTTISSSGPKLKSDQWRVAGALYLPVTLIRLWSKPGSDKASTERRELLHLTMQLFSAIAIITSRVTSASHAHEYIAHMTDYRQQLQRIFPKYKCHPNHHMAMHLDRFIEAYGPVHGWWTFPFERMIGVLQRVPMNYKAGEYEETIARTWHRRANLKLLLSKTTCPPIIQQCVSMYSALVKPLERNSMASLAEECGHEELDDADDGVRTGKSQRLSPGVIAAFAQRGVNCPTTAIHMNRYRERGVSYAARHVHEGNSGVIVSIKETDVPISIETFLLLPEVLGGSKLWIVGSRHSLARVRSDPYAAYPYLRAKMWSPDLDDTLEVFPFSAIKGHFAKCIIPWVIIAKRPKKSNGEVEDGTGGGGVIPAKKSWAGQMRHRRRRKIETGENADKREANIEYVDYEKDGEVAVCVSLSRMQATL